MLDRRCPLCGSRDVRFFAEHNRVKQKLCWCTDCRLYFVSPHISFIPSVTDRNEIRRPFQFWGSPKAHEAYSRWRHEENTRIARLVTNLGRIDRVLEIGFGEGPLTRRLLPFVREYWGLEPVPATHRRTVDELSLDPDRALCIKAEDLVQNRRFLREHNTFDLIVMVSVFEHISRPAKVLETCFNLLKPGGKVFLSTPDSTHFGWLYRGRLALGMEPWSHFHISFFNKVNLELLFSKQGFHIAQITHAPLLTVHSIDYFGALTGSFLVRAAMTFVRFSRLDKVLCINTFNYVLQKPEKSVLDERFDSAQIMIQKPLWD